MIDEVLDALRWLAGVGGLLRFGVEDEQAFVRASVRLDGDADRLVIAKVPYESGADPLIAVVQAIGEIGEEAEAQQARGRLRAV